MILNETFAPYLEGGSLRITASLTDYDGAALDPTVLRLLLLLPGATESIEHSIEFENSTSVAVLALTTPGLWRYRFESTSGIPAAEEGQFQVSARTVPPPP